MKHSNLFLDDDAPDSCAAEYFSCSDSEVSVVLDSKQSLSDCNPTHRLQSDKCGRKVTLRADALESHLDLSPHPENHPFVKKSLIKRLPAFARAESPTTIPPRYTPSDSILKVTNGTNLERNDSSDPARHPNNSYDHITPSPNRGGLGIALTEVAHLTRELQSLKDRYRKHLNAKPRESLARLSLRLESEEKHLHRLRQEAKYIEETAIEERNQALSRWLSPIQQSAAIETLGNLMDNPEIKGMVDYMSLTADMVLQRHRQQVTTNATKQRESLIEKIKKGEAEIKALREEIVLEILRSKFIDGMTE